MKKCYATLATGSCIYVVGKWTYSVITTKKILPDYETRGILLWPVLDHLYREREQDIVPLVLERELNEVWLGVGKC